MKSVWEEAPQFLQPCMADAFTAQVRFRVTSTIPPDLTKYIELSMLLKPELTMLNDIPDIWNCLFEQLSTLQLVGSVCNRRIGIRLSEL